MLINGYELQWVFDTASGMAIFYFDNPDPDIPDQITHSVPVFGLSDLAALDFLLRNNNEVFYDAATKTFSHSGMSPRYGTLTKDLDPPPTP
jgi:hypothetical protein